MRIPGLMSSRLPRFSSLFLLLCIMHGAFAQLAQNPGTVFGNSSSLNTPGLQEVMPAVEAFALNAYIESPATIVLFWDIRDGYYMYNKSLEIRETGGTSLADPVIPQGIIIEDRFFGEVEVYYERLLIRIPFDREQAGSHINLNLNYQGCAEDRYCYPVQTTSLSLEVPGTDQ